MKQTTNFFIYTTLLFMGQKLSGTLMWSWWGVFVPVYVFAAILFAGMFYGYYKKLKK
jgi:hypothetical protein